MTLERQAGSIVAGKYRLRRVLGRGGMGVVYEAEHAMTRRHVAVKVLHSHHKESSDAAKRFVNEAQAAGRIAHPNVVEVLDAGQDTDGSLYLVLELLTGSDLATHLMRVRRIDVAEAVVIIAQVLQALVVAHRQGIIHRDIKPENIFLTRSVVGDTHVKILDFGISKAIGPTAENAPALSVTQTNTTVGTPHYMSPEQARGERTIDTRADLWAVAVVLYECLAGRVPFDGDTYNDQIVRVITEPHVALSNFDVPLELSRIVDKGLEKDKNRRYARAAEILADLRRFIERHREYAAHVSPHLLREPAPTAVPAPAARPDNPTIETTRDPAFDPALPPSSDTLPEVPASAHLASASIFDAANEDAPTTVRAVSEDGPPSVAPLPPLAGQRTATGAGPTSTAPHPRVVVAPIDERRRNLIIAGVLLASAVVIGAIAAIAASRPTARASSAANPHGAASPQSALVTLRFVGLPPAAQLTVGGMPIAPGTNAVVLARSDQPTNVVITVPGYGPISFPVTPAADQTIPIALPPPPVIPTPDRLNSDPSDEPVGEATGTAPGAPALGRRAPGWGATPSGAGGDVGTLTVVSPLPCTVAIDGQTWRDAPIARAPMSAGPHRVTCRTSAGQLRTRNVSVMPNRDTVVDFSR